MASRSVKVWCFLDRLCIVVWVTLLSSSLTVGPVMAQTNCSNYNSCVTGTASNILTGNITYCFNEASLTELLGDTSTIQDFKNRIDAAANDWATTTGRTITRASAGQTCNVTISASDESNVRDDNGVVTNVPGDNTRRNMQFSDEWGGWTPEGKDRLASHEWGHIMGLS
jgi:hypothetical protein